MNNYVYIVTSQESSHFGNIANILLESDISIDAAVLEICMCVRVIMFDAEQE